MTVPKAIRDTKTAFARWCQDSAARIRAFKTSRGRYFQGSALAPRRAEVGKQAFGLITDGRAARTGFPGTTEMLRVTRYESPEGEGWFIEARVRRGKRVFEYRHDGDGPRDFSQDWTEVFDA